MYKLALVSWRGCFCERDRGREIKERERERDFVRAHECAILCFFVSLCACVCACVFVSVFLCVCPCFRISDTFDRRLFFACIATFFLIKVHTWKLELVHTCA